MKKNTNPSMDMKPSTSARTKMLAEDAYTDNLDAALTSAEESLRKLLPTVKPSEIAEAFETHVHTHLSSELSNIATHGHRNDDSDDVPPTNQTPGQAGLTTHENDTILAALRLWQKEAAHVADGDGAIADIAEEHSDALTNVEIDELCERINSSPVKWVAQSFAESALQLGLVCSRWDKSLCRGRTNTPRTELEDLDRCTFKRILVHYIEVTNGRKENYRKTSTVRRRRHTYSS